MRLSDVLGSEVVDGLGERVGIVHDVRARIGPDEEWHVEGIVVDGDGLLARAAHAWGYASGRSEGPAPLRRLLGAPARARAGFVPCEMVEDWGPGLVRIAGRADSYPRLEAALWR